MAQFPAIMLWTDAWVADTHHLSRLERGTYMDLLVLMWRTPGCRVPNDDEWLGKRLKMSPAEVKNELRPLVEEFCKTDGNWITQKRLLAEFSKVAKSCTRQSVRAKARWDNEKKSAAAMHPQPQPQLTLIKKEDAPTVRPPVDQEADLFRRGKDVLKSPSSGGLIKKVLAAKNGDVALARAAVEMASTKGDPREYLGAVARGAPIAAGGNGVDANGFYPAGTKMW